MLSLGMRPEKSSNVRIERSAMDNMELQGELLASLNQVFILKKFNVFF